MYFVLEYSGYLCVSDNNDDDKMTITVLTAGTSFTLTKHLQSGLTLLEIQ
jgi:hypothetical protein